MNPSPFKSGDVLKLANGKTVRLDKPDGIGSWAAQVLQSDGKVEETLFYGASELVGATLAPKPADATA